VHRKTKRIARECVWVGWCAHTHTQNNRFQEFKSGRPHHETHTHTNPNDDEHIELGRNIRHWS